VGTSFFRFVTNHAFDRQTDRRTDTQQSRGYTGRYVTCSRAVKARAT